MSKTRGTIFIFDTVQSEVFWKQLRKYKDNFRIIYVTEKGKEDLDNNANINGDRFTLGTVLYGVGSTASVDALCDIADEDPIRCDENVCIVYPGNEPADTDDDPKLDQPTIIYENDIEALRALNTFISDRLPKKAAEKSSIHRNDLVSNGKIKREHKSDAPSSSDKPMTNAKGLSSYQRDTIAGVHTDGDFDDDHMSDPRIQSKGAGTWDCCWTDCCALFFGGSGRPDRKQYKQVSNPSYVAGLEGKRNGK